MNPKTAPATPTNAAVSLDALLAATPRGRAVAAAAVFNLPLTDDGVAIGKLLWVYGLMLESGTDYDKAIATVALARLQAAGCDPKWETPE